MDNDLPVAGENGSAPQHDDNDTLPYASAVHRMTSRVRGTEFLNEAEKAIQSAHSAIEVCASFGIT